MAENLSNLKSISISAISKLHMATKSPTPIKYRVLGDGTNDEYVNKIEIQFPLILYFSENIDYGIHEFHVTNVNQIEFHNLSMQGCIYCSNSTIKIENCKISNPPNGVDYIVLCENSCKCTISNCLFQDTNLYGIGIDSASNCEILSCNVMNCHQFSIVITGNSFCNLVDSKIDKSSTDLICVESSFLNINKCELKNAANSAINLYDASFHVVDTLFTDNGKGGFSIRNCMNGSIINCRIIDSNDTAILLENGVIVVEKTTIHNCNGNGINAQVSSRATIRNCTFTDAKWPLAAFCDSSTGLIYNTSLENCSMSGLIARHDSSVYATNTIIRNCAETAIRISDSNSAKFEKCLIHDCRYSGVEICDKSTCHFDECIFAGGFNVGINCYSGGNAIVSNSTILGPFEKAVWCHYGGYGQFTNLILDNLQLQLKVSAISSFVGHAKIMRQLDNGKKILEMVEYKKEDDSKSSSDLIPAGKNKSDSRYFCIETDWFVTATNCYIFGVGNYELIANPRRKKMPEDMKALIPAPCLVCGKPATGIYFSPCGHSLYCTECWNVLENKPTQCPICHLQIEQSAHAINCNSEEDICGICYERKIDAIILPCGHSICKQCANHWFEQSTECPFCREEKAHSRAIVTYR